MNASPSPKDPIAFALPLVDMVCRLAGPTNLIVDGRNALGRHGVIGAVRRHDNAVLFDWLITTMSFQGIADRLAQQYIKEHGNITWADIQRDLRGKPSCGKLSGFWAFDDCGYQKLAATCSEPSQFSCCPLPVHNLRNGRLNATAYSLFFFIRDVAGSDLVQWIDDQIAVHIQDLNGLTSARDALIGPLSNVYGISSKVVSMALSQLFLAIGQRRPHWFELGASFIVIDTLVHNFLHRTGILRAFDASHLYGAGCYGPNGCADLIERLAQQIDASRYNADYPRIFPRFLQIALWRYCSENGLDICNGNRTRDADRCSNVYCQLRQRCERVAMPKIVKKRVFSAS